MLPGFRFLFAAIVLSMSLMIFGLGAAALLRSAHEEFAANPSWRAAPEVTFAQGGEATRPVLAALRVEPPVAEKPQDNESSMAAPSEETATTTLPDDVSEPIATATPEEASAAEPVKPEAATPELSAGETIAAGEAAQISAEKPKPAEEVQIAAQLALIDAGAAAKVATLGGPLVDVEETTPKAKVTATAKQGDQAAAKKRAEARRAANRRQIAAARARQAAQQQTQQPQLNPFFQQQAHGAATH